MARPLKPRTPLGERLIAVREALGFTKRDGFAERLGVPADTLGTYERGVAAPSPDLLATYYREFGVNISWLVTGIGENMFDDISKAPAPSLAVEPWAMGRAYAVAERVYKEVGQPVSGNHLAEEAAALYSALLGRVSDVRDRPIVEAVLPVLAEDLRERLKAAEPGSGKHSAL